MKKLEEYFKQIEKRERMLAKIKAVAAVLYFNGLSFRKTTQVLKQTMGIDANQESVRLWWHSLAKFLRSIYILAMLVYVDEKKIKASNKKYLLWAALSAREKPVFLWLSARRDSKTAKLVLYNSKGYIYVTDKGPWYVKAVRELGVE